VSKQEQNIEINQSNKNSNKIVQQPVQKQLPQLPVKITSEKENILSDSFSTNLENKVNLLEQSIIHQEKSENLSKEKSNSPESPKLFLQPTSKQLPQLPVKITSEKENIFSDSFSKQIQKQLPQIPQQKIEKLKEDNLIETSLYAEQKQQETKKDSFKEEKQIESTIHPLTPESPKLLLKPSNKIKQPILELETKIDEPSTIKQEVQKSIEEHRNQTTKNKSTVPIESTELNKTSSVSIVGQVKQTSPNQKIYENLDHSSKLTSELASNLTKKLPQLPKFSDIKDLQTNLENKVNLLEQSIIHQEKSENLSKEKSNSPESPKLFLQPTSKQLPQLPVKITSEKENIFSDSFSKQIQKQLPQIPQQKIEKLKEDNLIETSLYAEQKQQETKKDSFKEEKQIESTIHPLTPESPKLLLKPSNKIKQPILELETKIDEPSTIKQEVQKSIEEHRNQTTKNKSTVPIESTELNKTSSVSIVGQVKQTSPNQKIYENLDHSSKLTSELASNLTKKLPQLPKFSDIKDLQTNLENKVNLLEQSIIHQEKSENLSKEKSNSPESPKLFLQPTSKQLPQLPVKITSEKENIFSDSFSKQIQKQLPQIPQQKIEKLKEDNLIETSLYAEQKQQETKKDSFKEEKQIESTIHPLTPESPKLLLKPSNKIKQPILELETKIDEPSTIKQEVQKSIEDQKKFSEIIMNASTPESPKLLLQSSNRIKKSLPKLDSESEIFLNSTPQPNEKLNQLPSTPKKLPQLPIKDSTSKQLPQLPIKSVTNKSSESDYSNETVPLEFSNKEIKKTTEPLEYKNTTEEVTLITQEPDSSQLPFIKKNITQSNLNMSYINKSDDENENSPNLLKQHTQSKTDNKMSNKNSAENNKIQTVFCPVRPAKKKQLGSEINLSFDTSQTINQNNDIDSLFLENQKEIDNNNSTIKKQVDRKKSTSNNLYRSESPEDMFMYNSSKETPNKSKLNSRLVKDDSNDDLFKSNNSNKVSRLSSIDSTYKQNQSPIQKQSNQDLFQKTVNESPTFQKKVSKFIKKDSNEDLFQISTHSDQLNNSLKDVDSEKQINESNQDLFENNKEIQQLRKNKSKKIDSNDNLYSNNQSSQPQTEKINNLYKKNSDPDLSSQSKRSSLKSVNQNSRPESRATNESIKQTKQENNNNLSRKRWKAAFYKIRLQLRYVSFI
jgi:hypothetical protein